MTVVVSANSLSLSNLFDYDQDSSSLGKNKICITDVNFATMNCFKMFEHNAMNRLISAYQLTTPACCFLDNSVMHKFSKGIFHNMESHTLTAFTFCPGCVNPYHYFDIPSMLPLDNYLMFVCSTNSGRVHCLGPAMVATDPSHLVMIYFQQQVSTLNTMDLQHHRLMTLSNSFIN